MFSKRRRCDVSACEQAWMEMGKLVEVCALDLFLEYVVIALKVFFTVFCYGVYFSCSSAFGLFLAYEKAFLF